MKLCNALSLIATAILSITLSAEMCTASSTLSYRVPGVGDFEVTTDDNNASQLCFYTLGGAKAPWHLGSSIDGPLFQDVTIKCVPANKNAKTARAVGELENAHRRVEYYVYIYGGQHVIGVLHNDNS
ncbi:uncharacterized protein PFL1_04164 [Pseudozyma flocculosa PF-1]|uniref:Uncharacterized protein n=2 Tax=Pseudozyma flocculosa TaxID=84751 RepID=A0A5C3ET93_9BASI|nr:uncharacterized protein PFL1_04164 [Pseudozyma flocculosa PF-1]EPQ28337.1 hypothetical protein PFL1_04164 [Pseudozyma flocculosa PF-1]SPO35488.1 uncharacterized protein PSFLO_00959 [Pseudozyma flocculosa]